MKSSTDPRLDISVVRWVGAGVAGLATVIEDDPSTPEEVMDFVEALTKFENWLHKRPKPLKYFREGQVKFHPTDNMT